MEILFKNQKKYTKYQYIMPAYMCKNFLPYPLEKDKKV